MKIVEKHWRKKQIFAKIFIFRPRSWKNKNVSISSGSVAFAETNFVGFKVLIGLVGGRWVMPPDAGEFSPCVRNGVREQGPWTPDKFSISASFFGFPWTQKHYFWIFKFRKRPANVRKRAEIPRKNIKDLLRFSLILSRFLKIYTAPIGLHPRPLVSLLIRCPLHRR